MRALLAFSFLFAANLSASSIAVTAMLDGIPVPGVTVTAQPSGGGVVFGDDTTRVTDTYGRALFAGVGAGEFHIAARLDGFVPFDKTVTTYGDSITEVTAAMRIDSSETLTFTCSTPCGDERPAGPYDPPLCEDFYFVADLIQRLPEDGSIVRVLERRFDAELTSTIRQQIAGALADLPDGRGRRFAEYLEADAQAAFLLLQLPSEMSGDEPLEIPDGETYRPTYRDTLYPAFHKYAECRASHDFLILVVEWAEDPAFVATAIDGLARQQSVDALHEIELALQRFPGETGLAGCLLPFDDPRAHHLAHAYLNAEDAGWYDQELAARAKQGAPGEDR